jgi:hypothetical protein
MLSPIRQLSAGIATGLGMVHPTVFLMLSALGAGGLGPENTRQVRFDFFRLACYLSVTACSYLRVRSYCSPLVLLAAMSSLLPQINVLLPCRGWWLPRSESFSRLMRRVAVRLAGVAGANRSSRSALRLSLRPRPSTGCAQRESRYNRIPNV